MNCHRNVLAPHPKLRECPGRLEFNPLVHIWILLMLSVHFLHGFLLVNLLSFVGRRDLIFGEPPPPHHHLCNEDSLKIDNCHIHCKLKWKLKTII